MPYVQRDSKGNITTTHATIQPGRAEEELPDDNPELLAFYAMFPPGFLTPPTEAEWAKIRANNKRLAKEHEKIRNSISLFNTSFSELEIALSALLYQILNILNSRVAYAIYFSPTSFEARCEIVDNALREVIAENAELRNTEQNNLQPLWDRIFKHVNNARKIRNTIAHGNPQTLVINGKSHARLAAPAFDVIRLNRKIAKRQVPGLTASDISGGIQTARFAHDRIDETNRLIASFHNDRPTLPQRFRELEAGLQTSRSQKKVVQIQSAIGFQSPPSQT